MTEISSNNQRIVKNTMVLYVRMFFIMLVTIYTSRVVLRVLGVQDFGIYNVVGGVVAMLGLLKGAMSSATTRFLTFELGRKDFEQLRKVYCTTEEIYALISFLLVIVAETLGLWFVNTQLIIPENRIVATNWVYQFTVFSIVIELMAQPCNAVIIAHERMSFYAYLSIMEVVLRLLIVYLIEIVPYDKLAVYGFLMMVTSLIIRIAYYVYCRQKFEECRFKIYKDRQLFRKLLSFSGWNLFGSASSLVKGQGLNILLNMFFSPSINAARGIAYQISGAMSLFSNNFYTAVRPQITKYYAQDDLNNMFKLVFRSSRFSFYLNLLFTVPLLIETPGIIDIWLGQVPEYVVPFSRLIIVITLIESMSHPLMTSIHATGNVAVYQSLVGTLNILNLPISYVFLKFGYSPYIVFYISLVITILSIFVRTFLVKHNIPSFPLKDFVIKVLGKCMFISVLSFILPRIVYEMIGTSLIEIIAVCATSVIYTVLVIYYLGINKNERLFVKGKIINKLFRK